MQSERESKGVDRVLQFVSAGAAVAYGAASLAALDRPVGSSPIPVEWALGAVIACTIVAVACAFRQGSFWRTVLALGGVLAWTTSSTWADPAFSTRFLFDPERPLAIGIAGVVLGLSTPRVREAIAWSAATLGISLVFGLLAGTQVPVTLAGLLWGTNVAVVCVVGGASIRLGAAVNRRSRAALMGARQRRLMGEQIAAQQTADDIVLHDELLAVLTILSHGGDGVDPEWLRRSCVKELDALSVPRADDGPDVRQGDLGDLVRSWREFAAHIGLAMRVVGAAEADAASVNPRAAGVLDGAVREALRNISFHAGVVHALLEIRCDVDEGVTVTVSDPGQGFDPELRDVGHFGLSVSIRSRMVGIGGSAAVRSGLSAGTTVTLTLPASVLSDAGPSNPGPSNPVPSDAVLSDAEELAVSASDADRSGHPDQVAGEPLDTDVDHVARSADKALLAIGWVGAIDGAIGVLLFRDAYVDYAATVAFLVALLAIGLTLSLLPKAPDRRVRNSVIFTGVASILLVGTVASLFTTKPEFWFTQANLGVTTVSLAFAWLFWFGPVRQVVAVAILHAVLLIGCAAWLAWGTPELALLVLTVVAQTLIVPLGFSAYAHLVFIQVKSLEALERQIVHTRSATMAAAFIADATVIRMAGIRAAVVPLLTAIASGEQSLPLDRASRRAIVQVAHGIRDELVGGKSLTWLSAAVRRRDNGRTDAADVVMIRVSDGQRAAEGVPDAYRTALLATVDLFCSAVGTGDGRVRVVVAERDGAVMGAITCTGAWSLSAQDLRTLNQFAGEIGGSVLDGDSTVLAVEFTIPWRQD